MYNHYSLLLRESAIRLSLFQSRIHAQSLRHCLPLVSAPNGNYNLVYRTFTSSPLRLKGPTRNSRKPSKCQTIPTHTTEQQIKDHDGSKAKTHGEGHAEAHSNSHASRTPSNIETHAHPEATITSQSDSPQVSQEHQAHTDPPSKVPKGWVWVNGHLRRKPEPRHPSCTPATDTAAKSPIVGGTKQSTAKSSSRRDKPVEAEYLLTGTSMVWIKRLGNG
jgi:hypothetical protein